MTKQRYPTDLTDEQWQLIKSHFSKQRHYKWEKRELINAVLYITKTGFQWRMLPSDFPPYPTVWSFYRRAKQIELWDEILQGLVKKKRLVVGKKAIPTYAIIDSQSVKTTSKAENRGFDGGKKVKGRKRHILVDTIGNLLGVVVHAANIHDTKAGIQVVDKVMEIYPSIQAISADAGYRKTFEKDVLENHHIPVDISKKINGDWSITPKRWVVERSFAWLNNFRRFAKDYEISVTSAESFVKIAHIAQLLRNLCL